MNELNGLYAATGMGQQANGLAGAANLQRLAQGFDPNGLRQEARRQDTQEDAAARAKREADTNARQRRVAALEAAIAMGLQGHHAIEAARLVEDYVWPKEGTAMPRLTNAKAKKKSAKAAKRVAKKTGGKAR